MAERKKSRKRKDENPPPGTKATVDKPSKEEYAVAKWIRENVPSKKTKFVSHNVEYFTGSRAVGALVENSPWNKTLFETREQVVEFLDKMLRHKFFHRAKKIVVTEEELNKLRGLKKKVKDCCRDDNNVKKEKEKDKDREIDKDNSNNELKDNKDDDTNKEKDVQQKKKPKVRLEMHMDQYFCDCNDAYVWIYEPIPIYYWFFGTLVVLGAIGVCLFPLWPLSIRHGVYYLSVAAAGFFVFILALAVVRIIVFSLLWILTFGRHHLWLLPNLAEDVGFLASFWPLYQYEYIGADSEKNNKIKKKKQRRKDKESDVEDNCQNQGEEEKLISDKNTKQDNKEDDGSGEEGSESEKSNTGKDFEMVQHNELEDK